MDARLEEGRAASAEALALALATAPLSYLEGALANPATHPRHLLLALRNPTMSGPLILRISQNRSWIKDYDLKAAIVLHPKAPRAVAMNLVSFLWWRDLARVVDRGALAPPLRRTAERILALRLQELALGEKITLARIASRGVINALRQEQEPMVIRALLQNPRLVEEDALAIASSRRTPPALLQALAEDARWSQRPSVQKAIARHPETPARLALHILRGLTMKDLKELAQAARVPGLVKVAAQRLLESRRHPIREGSSR